MIASFVQELERVFGWLVAASWQASVLAVFVLLIQGILGSKLNPRWRYTLWLLVLLRLVLPVQPESALSLFQFAPKPPAALEVSVTEPLFISGPTLPAPSVPLEVAEPSRPFSFYSLLAVIWLAGAMALLLLTWMVNRRFARQVADSPEIADPELLRLFAEAKAELGVRRAIRLIENGQVQSPAIMGLFAPTLLLPADARKKFDARELRFIFLHELAHLKRGDVMVQALIALLQILHWFNPVLWYAFRRMRIDREPATDALVLSRTGESEKERYGLMLIKLLEHFNQRHSLPTLVGILEDKDQFKRRFSLIARFTRGAYGWSVMGVLIIGVLSIACLTKSKATELSNTAKDDAGANTTEADASDDAAFNEALENDRTVVADSSVHSSTLAADAQMLEAIKAGDVVTLKKVLEHGVDPHTFDPDRFNSSPTYWAVYFHQPEALKLLLEHKATGNDDGPTGESALELAQKAHPDLVSILKDGMKRNHDELSAELTEQLHSMHVDLPSYTNMPLSSVVGLLLKVTAKTGYLERRVSIDTMDLPAATTLTFPQAKNVSIWDAVKTIADANNLKFEVGEEEITLYPPRDEAIIHPQTDKVEDVPPVKAEAGNRPEQMAQFTTKLKSIHVELPSFVGASLGDVISILCRESKKADPSGQGIDVLVPDSPPFTSTKVTLSPLNGVSLYDGLRAVCEATNLEFYVDENIVRIHEAETLLVKTFVVPDGFFPAESGTMVDVKQELASRGISLPSSASATYVPGKSRLVVRATALQLLNIEDLLAAKVPIDRGGAPTTDASQAALTGGGEQGKTPGDHIKIRLIMAEIKKDVYLANKEKVEVAVKNADIGYLNQLTGVNVLSAPSVETDPGEKATVEITRELPFPVSFEKDKDGKFTPTDFDRRDCGIRADLTPKEQNGKIQVSGNLTLTDFEGFTFNGDTDTRVGCPTFTTVEGYIFEEFENENQFKGMLLPGIQHEPPTGLWLAGKPNLPAEPGGSDTRLIVFLSAGRVK